MFAVLTALFVIVGLGLSAPSYAAGNGNSGSHAKAPAHAKKMHAKRASVKNSSTKPATRRGNGKSTAGSHATTGTAGTTGTPPESQPLSNADQNAGGANGQCPGGPYCGTVRDQPSMNGNNVGAATGKPCAGCVGKADNKNPKGQQPGPQDLNNGYECDGNNGIAKGNPAHTSCTPPEDEGCVPVEGQDASCNPIVIDDNCLLEGQEGCDDADTPPLGTDANRPPVVLGTEVFAQPGKAKVGPAQAVTPAAVLPATGSSSGLGLLGFGGLALVVAGGAMLALRRATAH
jgi:hypothetical protein